MAKIENLDKLAKELKRRIQQSKDDDDVSVEVGYVAEYAIYVHENLEAHHPVGQAKYLEQPFREMELELAVQVANDLRNKIRLRQALYRAGLRLQRASMQLVPVDTGNLRAGAYTRIVDGRTAS